MLDKKADVLFLVMGGNPFPNLISAATRVKENGRIICICSKKTENDLYENFKRTVQSNLVVDFDKITIDDTGLKTYFNRDTVKEKVAGKLKNELSSNPSIGLLELNYTGGTKLMSTTSYEVIKNYDYSRLKADPTINLTYIDPEKEVMYCEFKEKRQENYKFCCETLCKLKPTFELNIKDVISIYVENYNISTKGEPENSEISKRLGSLWCNIEKELYDDRIELFRKLYYFGKEKSLEEIDKLFLEKKLFPDYTGIDSLGFKGKNRLFKYFEKTKWLEDYILMILLELKEEGVIEDVLANIEKKMEKGTLEFEVDFAAYRKYKLYAISVTSIDNPNIAKGKLYEIKQRARNLAGDEAGICYISLCWDTAELEKEYRNIWDRESLKNSLILGAQDFHLLKDKLREWLKGGERFDS